MNQILIDTASPNKIKVVLTSKDTEMIRELEQKFGSQVLLDLVSELLKESKIELDDLTAITVATGPGSYTGIRVGVAVANALGYSLGIPVNGKKIETEVVY